MSHINQQKIQYCFDSLWMIIADKQQECCGEISFQRGLIREEEGYKYRILERAKAIIADIPWTDADIIESGKITAMAMELLTIQPFENGKLQNLVDYRDIHYFFDCADKKKKEIERLLYILYTQNRDEEVFKALSKVLHNKYALISYFFFLKDAEKYQVVRPNNFAERFGQIDAPTKCALVCSWENYETYNEVLAEVREFLHNCLYEEITLTDAHSFVWMFWMLKEYPLMGESSDSSGDDNCTTVYVSAKEGRKILYYTSKYERNPKIRAAAIRYHGYYCAVCGFNFEEKYGEIGKQFIEVHHIKPLFSLDGEMEVNPETDMVCLCANCHRMIHRKRNAVLTVSDLQKEMAGCRNA